MIQLREKGMADSELLTLARELRRLTREAGALFIVNDRPDLAVLVDADGVHVGQGDIPPQEVRRIVGADRLVGLSVENAAQIRFARGLDVDYLGLGPVFSTPTKPDAAPPTGLSLFKEMKALGEERPVYAIGGVNLTNAGSVLSAGAWGLAVVSAVVSAPDIQGATQKFQELLKKHPAP